jgi:predicted dehydrogenase
MANTQIQHTSLSKKNSKVRYAIVGLGWFAQFSALPAFIHTDNSEVVALVSGDPTKKAELSERYSIPYVCSYEEYDDLLLSGNIDAVYIALPNHLHCDYTVRAAKAGIHVLCEKPMAVTVEECDMMIRAAQDNSVKLMIAYRLHLEEANLKAIETIRSGQIGEPRIFSSLFTQQIKETNIRLKQETGGGTLNDIGIYCINAARYLFQDEPIAVFASSASNGEQRFREVPEMNSVILRFSKERLATFTCSFGAAKVETYQVVGTKGDLRVELAYSMYGPIKHILTIDGKVQQRTFEPYDQLAAEFNYFSDCILYNNEPEPSGIEGLIDIQIISALHNSIQTGRFVQIEIANRS